MRNALAILVSCTPLVLTGCGGAQPPQASEEKSLLADLPFALPAMCEVGPGREMKPNDLCLKPYSETTGGYYDELNVYEDDILLRMKEPSLIDTVPEDVTVFRLLYLPSFSHPFMVRVEKARDHVLILYKQLDGAGGFEPGEIEVVKARRLNPTEWQGILDMVAQASYWSMPSDSPTWGYDGVSLILEGVQNGRRHIVNHWSPYRTNYARLCFFLIKLAQPGEDVYEKAFIKGVDRSRLESRF